MEGDRLSDLPDCLLHTILSLLKARQVVQTCVLSRRWEHLWRSVPCLDIDHWDLHSTPEAFEDFADNLLSRRGVSSSSLDSFRLNVSKKYGDDDSSTTSDPCRWVRRALKQFSPRCSTSAAAAISGMTASVYLLWSLPPPASRLYLAKVRLLESRGFGDQLASASGFPVLEVLELRRCDYRLRRIESGTLKSLTIHDCRNTSGEDDVVIAAATCNRARPASPSTTPRPLSERASASWTATRSTHVQRIRTHCRAWHCSEP